MPRPLSPLHTRADPPAPHPALPSGQKGTRAATPAPTCCLHWGSKWTKARRDFGLTVLQDHLDTWQLNSCLRAVPVPALQPPLETACRPSPDLVPSLLPPPCTLLSTFNHDHAFIHLQVPWLYVLLFAINCSFSFKFSNKIWLTSDLQHKTRKEHCSLHFIQLHPALLH